MMFRPSITTDVFGADWTLETFEEQNEGVVRLG